MKLLVGGEKYIKCDRYDGMIPRNQDSRTNIEAYQRYFMLILSDDVLLKPIFPWPKGNVF